MTAVVQPQAEAPTEEEVLIAAWEALSKDGQVKFLSRLPPEVRAALLAHHGGDPRTDSQRRSDSPPPA